MGYVYAAMWLLAGIYLFYMGVKENKLFCFPGGYFIFLAGWWFVNELVPQNLLDGTYAVVLRCVSGAVLLVSVVLYIIQKKQKSKKDKDRP